MYIKRASMYIEEWNKKINFLILICNSDEKLSNAFVKTVLKYAHKNNIFRGATNEFKICFINRFYKF